MKNLLDLDPSDRAKEGIFLGFQYPIEVPGVSNFTFLKESFNQICEYQGLDKMDDETFLKHLRGKLKLLDMNESFLERSVNEGFSGGEKKKNEILQMAILNPRLSLLDAMKVRHKHSAKSDSRFSNLRSSLIVRVYAA